MKGFMKAEVPGRRAPARQSGPASEAEDEAEQRRLHYAADGLLGAFDGGNPYRSQEAALRIGDRLREKHER